MGGSARQSRTFSPFGSKQSSPLAGDGLLSEKGYLMALRDDEDAVVPIIKHGKPSARCWELDRGHARRQRSIKARCIFSIIMFTSFVWLSFIFPFKTPLLPWLGTSIHQVCSSICRFFNVPNMYNTELALNSSTPNITLAPFAFQPLELGSITPSGWLHDEMNLMSKGLAGHEYDFYHIVQHSPWLGGHSEYSGLNEGLPYWFNGLVPLAYGLNDHRLIQQVQDASDYILNHQYLDGWLGPESVGHRDLYGRFPFMLGLMQFVEAEPTRATRIIPAIYKYIELMHSMLLNKSGLEEVWGRVRFADMIIVLQWLYEKHPENHAQLLIETMFLLKESSLDWTSYWTEENFIFQDLDLIKPPIVFRSFDFAFTHGVNAVQGLKAGAVLYRFTLNESLIQTSRNAVNWTMAFHGDPAGSVIGDERESGSAPNRGSELCTAVEAMYSLSYLYQTLGDNTFADRCERAAFNALPVGVTSDHWARQYIALPNEPFADRLDGPTPFWNVGGEGIIYGLDNNYPCCTVNMPQGLPKFLSASYVKVGQDGIGHALLGPAEVHTVTESGASVNISCSTSYPFGMVLTYHVNASAAFTLYLRVPGWADLASSTVGINSNGAANPVTPNANTGMTPISLPAGTTTITYTLGASLRIEPRGNGSVSIYHGPLLYALDVGHSVTSLPANIYRSKNETFNTLADGPAVLPAQTHESTFANTKPWNIAIDPNSLQFHTRNSTDGALKYPIFDYEAPPTYITAKGCQINWALFRGIPAALPKLPDGAIWNCTGNVTDVVLRPYGSLKIHMAELPVVNLNLGQQHAAGHGAVRGHPRWVGER